MFIKINKKIYLLEDLKMLSQLSRLSHLSFIIIYLIHEISVSPKISQITLGMIFSNIFLRSIIDFYFFKKDN